MREDIRNIIIIFAICVLIIGGGIWLYSRSAGETNDYTNKQNVIVRNDSLKVGNGEKITLVEFADFECPACAIVSPAIEKILEEYKKDITFVFRHFPLTQHYNAVLAGKAGEAANDQGKFAEMYKKIYAERARWGDRKTLQTEVFIQFAREIGLDVEKFRSDIESDKYEEKIKNDFRDGISLGVNSTPTFFINNIKYVGAIPYENLKEIVEAELKK